MSINLKRTDQNMYKIVRKKELNSAVTLLEIEAPFIAKKAHAGQFIIFRIDDQGERVPLTIAGYDREKGTVTIIFQKVGFSTIALGNLNEGDYIRDFVGPLGKPTPVEGKKKEEEAPAEPPAPPAPSNEEVLLAEIRDLLKNK